MVRTSLLAATMLAVLGGPALAEPIIGLGIGNAFYRFDSASPGAVASLGSVDLGGEALLGIDYRPATGQLYALGSGSHIYTIALGAGTVSAAAVGSGGAFSLSGTVFGFDFNPTVDRIRVVSNTGQNLRLNPITGALAATDGTLAYASTDPNAGVTPGIIAAGYTNSVANATSTTLYVVDANANLLDVQNPPNAGTLNTVGSLAQAVNGFDISGASAIAYGSAVSPSGLTSLYAIDLASGAETALGTIGTGAVRLVDIAVAPVPEPGTMSLLAASAGLAWLARRRRPGSTGAAAIQPG